MAVNYQLELEREPVSYTHLYTFPLHMAAKFNTPFLCYGENVSFEYGGNADVETYSAKDQIENGVAVGFPKEELLGYCLLYTSRCV